MNNLIKFRDSKESKLISDSDIQIMLDCLREEQKNIEQQKFLTLQLIDDRTKKNSRY